jgi:hypothetical protein
MVELMKRGAFTTVMTDAPVNPSGGAPEIVTGALVSENMPRRRIKVTLSTVAPSENVKYAKVLPLLIHPVFAGAPGTLDQFGIVGLH